MTFDWGQNYQSRPYSHTSLMFPLFYLLNENHQKNKMKTYILRNAEGRSTGILQHQRRDYSMVPASNLNQAEKAAMRESAKFSGETVDLIEIVDGKEDVALVINF